MEFELIERIRARALRRDDVLLGIGDDAAVMRVAPGHELVIGTDTLNIDVHFPAGTAAADVGWKALAVNLSDLAAMGATPAWCTLSLSLPSPDADWIDAFLDGFVELAAQHQVALVGGDTTRGPLSITVTACGLVPTGSAIRRKGARPGDDLWLTGSTGAAAAALQQLQCGDAIDAVLRARLDRPTPRVAAGIALRAHASACIDVSDGLLADLSHLLRASAVGAQLQIAALPMAAGLAAVVPPAQRWQLQLCGGDDYELCFTAARPQRDAISTALAACDTPAQVIGVIEAGDSLGVLQPDGCAWAGAPEGWDHFRERIPGVRTS